MLFRVKVLVMSILGEMELEQTDQVYPVVRSQVSCGLQWG